jgi:hypothetical protein
LSLVRLRRNDVVAQVLAIEPGDDRRRVVELELRDDVGADVRRRRRGQGNSRRPTESLANSRDAQIARPEIVAPLADAMGFVHGEQRDTGVAQPLGGRSEVEPLGRDVEQFHVAANGARQPVGHLRRRQRAVHEGRRQAARLERVDLIFHERNERRDDDGELRQDERRNLVAKRFSAARGKDDECVAARQNRFKPPLPVPDETPGIRNVA